jgi:hypothetical protein
MKSGTIGEYFWGQFSGETPQLSVADVVRGLSDCLIGLRAVNVSWDSGRMQPSNVLIESGWKVQGSYAVSPTIDASLVKCWPMNDCCGFDEWYFFKDVPIDIEVKGFCNWGVGQVGDWPNLVCCQPDNINLQEQLVKYQPELVIGEGYFIFVIAKDPKVIQLFRTFASEP